MWTIVATVDLVLENSSQPQEREILLELKIHLPRHITEWEGIAVVEQERQDPPVVTVKMRRNVVEYSQPQLKDMRKNLLFAVVGTLQEILPEGVTCHEAEVNCTILRTRARR